MALTAAHLNRMGAGALVATLHHSGLDTLWQRLADADAADDAGNAERDRPWRERLNWRGGCSRGR